MNEIKQSKTAIVLTLDAHGGATREQRLYGGVLEARFLNVTGRWASSGTDAAPLLTWESHEEAETCAETASRSRSRPVRVYSVKGARYGVFASYGKQHASALFGYLPYSAAAARKLEGERKRLMGYASVMLAGITESQDADKMVAAMKQEAHRLRDAGIGGGSWLSAAQGLTGKKALDVFQRIIDGELECDAGLTPEAIWQAIQIGHALSSRR
jgi:hypothetical protein